MWSVSYEGGGNTREFEIIITHGLVKHKTKFCIIVLEEYVYKNLTFPERQMTNNINN